MSKDTEQLRKTARNALKGSIRKIERAELYANLLEVEEFRELTAEAKASIEQAMELLEGDSEDDE